jgi:hypothetical protein
MCSGIVVRTVIAGSGKGLQEWFPVTQANVSYDHPTHAFMEDSLNIDFVNEAKGPEARVAVELSHDSARALVRAILGALEAGEASHGEAAESTATPG